MSTRLSTRAYLAVLAVAGLVLAVLAAALPHDPYIRYQTTKGTIYERTRFQYERLHFDPTPIDIVFIGSSRTAGGVDRQPSSGNSGATGSICMWPTSRSRPPAWTSASPRRAKRFARIRKSG